MKRTTMTLLGAALLTASLPLLAAETAQDENPLKKTAESIDIMRRVIVKSINRELGDYVGLSETEEESDGSGKATSRVNVAPRPTTRSTGGGFTYVTSAGGFASISGFAGQSRGHYVPGHGAIFSLQVTVPREAVDAEEVAEEKPEADDLWDEAEREASGRPALGGSTRTWLRSGDEEDAKVYVLDEDALDATITAIIAAVGKHGLKIDGLGADESIIVALDAEGGSVRLPKQERDDLTLYSALAYTIATGDDEQHIVIELAIEDVNRYAGDRIDLDGLKERAKITKY